MSSTDKIVRTPTEAKGGITSEEKRQLDAHAKKWERIIMRTDKIDPQKIVPAIEKLYEVSGLKKPRVVIVPSPLVGQIASGLARTVWLLRGAATDDATDWVVRLSEQLVGKDNIENALREINKAWNYRSGGNMWGQYDSYLTALRDVIGLTGLDCWEKYAPWEEAAKEGGYRWLQPEFCMVSDFPEVLERDTSNRPHCDTGSSHRWRDGFSVYYLHGVRFGYSVDGKDSEDVALWRKITSKKMTAEEALAIKDVDQRAIAIKYLGAEEMIKALKAELVDSGEIRMYRHLPNRTIERVYTEGEADVINRNKLYKVENFMDTGDTECFLSYKDPSTGEQYMSFVTPMVEELGEDADACMARKHHYLTKEAYIKEELEA